MVGARPRAWYPRGGNKATTPSLSSISTKGLPPSSSSSAAASYSSAAGAAEHTAKPAAAPSSANHDAGLFQFDTTTVEDPNGHLPFDCEFCQRAYCSHCEADIRTNYETELSWLHPATAILSWLLLGWFAWIPLLALWGQLKDVVHTCPKCRNVIGRRSRLGFPSLRSAVVTCRCASCAVMVNRKYVLVCLLLLSSVTLLVSQETIPVRRLPFFRAVAAVLGSDTEATAREEQLLDPTNVLIEKKSSSAETGKKNAGSFGPGFGSPETSPNSTGGDRQKPAIAKATVPGDQKYVFSNMTWEEYFAATSHHTSKGVNLRPARASLKAAAKLKGRVVRWQGKVVAIRSRISSPDEAVANAILFSMDPDRSITKMKNLGSVVVFFGIDDRFQVQDLVPGVTIEFQAQLVKPADDYNPDLMRLHPGQLKTLVAASETTAEDDAASEDQLGSLDPLLSQYSWSVHLAGTEDLVNGHGLVGMLSHNDPTLQMGLVLVLLVGVLLLYTLFMYVQDECMS